MALATSLAYALMGLALFVIILVLIAIIVVVILLIQRGQPCPNDTGTILDDPSADATPLKPLG